MAKKQKVTDSSARVALMRCGEYDTDRVFAAVKGAIDEVGGIDHYVKKGSRVLLKPNLLIARTAEKQVTTHPEVIRALIKLVKKAGGTPLVGDSPAMGSATRVASKCGIADVAAQEGVEIVDFNRPVDVENPADTKFKRFKIDQAVLDADVVINVPKLKTHGQMTLTLGVKNLFGVVPGTRKSQWHLAAGTDRMHFGRMLVDLYRKVSPALTLMDGIVGMHGNGPQNGDLKKVGLIMASADAVALDAVICEMVGLDRDHMPTLVAAGEMGVGQSRLEGVTVAGEKLDDARVTGFVLPEASDLMGMFPGFLREPVRDWLTTRPVADPKKCEMCLVCVNNCPAQVIAVHNDSLRFDLKRCIRCFCCQEMCPHGAIHVGSGPLAKLLRL
jgi:uncharacterized protein (DUF362 family)/Pyruvate/2-oxoacid:ferredoxin oxidoreductase delta subunit